MSASCLKLTAGQYASSSNGTNLARVSDLPIVLRQDLCRRLDVDNGWKDLSDAAGMTSIEVGVIETRCARSMSSPADQLLSQWVQRKHPRVLELYTALIERKRIMEAQLIEHLVPANLRHQKPEPQYSMELFAAPPAPKEKAGVQQRELSFPLDTPREFSEPNQQSANPGSDVRRSPPDRSSTSTAPAITTGTSGTVGSTRAELPSCTAAPLEVRRFSYEEIREATKNFSKDCLIGQGRFSRVFKCTMQNTTYAVKEKDVKPCDISVDMELALMQSYPHENILPIYGCCVTPEKVFLCCQFMANNSLADRLSPTGVTLLCEQRCHIAVGAARGLQYLHNLPNRPIIHGNIKSSNILLDKHLEAKLSDFASARFATGSSGGSSSSGAGSSAGAAASGALLTHYTKQDGDPLGTDAAYTAPELLEALGCVQPSIKSDTYSFGIVLLEMCTGLRASGSDGSIGGSAGTIDWLRAYVANVWSVKPSDGVQDVRLRIVDPRIAWDHEFFLELLQLAQSCCNLRKKDRPTMSLVFESLQRSDVTLQIRQRAHAEAAAAAAAAAADSDPAAAAMTTTSATTLGSGSAVYGHHSTDNLSLNYHLSSDVDTNVATIYVGNLSGDAPAAGSNHIVQQLGTMPDIRTSSTWSTSTGGDTSSGDTNSSSSIGVGGSSSSSLSMSSFGLVGSSASVSGVAAMSLLSLRSPHSGVASETSDDVGGSSGGEVDSEETPPVSPDDALGYYMDQYGDASATGESDADLLLQGLDAMSLPSNEPTESSTDD